MNTRHPSLTHFCLLVACVAVAPVLLALPTQAADLAALVGTMPDADRDGKYTGPAPEEAQKVYDVILEGGAASIAELVGILVPPGEAEDYKARYVLHGIAIYVGRPGAEAQRRMFGEALISTLSSDIHKEVKRFVIQELQFLGETRAVNAIGRFLLDEAVCDDAAMALVALREGAAGTLAGALPHARGQCRLAIIQALGELRHAQSVPALIRALGEGYNDARLAAAVALGKIGDPTAVEPMLRTAAAAHGFPRVPMCDACLVLAENLCRAGNDNVGLRVYERMWTGVHAWAESQLRYAVVEGLAPPLASESSSNLIRQLRDSSPATRAAIVHLLGQRGDPAAFDSVASAMRDRDPGVRLVAASSLPAVGAEKSIPLLIGALPGESPEAARVLHAALLTVPGEGANEALADGLGNVRDRPDAAATRIFLLDVVTRRNATEAADAALFLTGNRDPAVRIAAVRALGALAGGDLAPSLVDLLAEAKDADELRALEDALVATCQRISPDGRRVEPLLPALAVADAEARCTLLRIAGRIGSGASVPLLLEALENNNATVRDAAMQSLADFPNDKAAPDLLRIAKTTDNPDHQVAAFRGYMRIAERKGGNEQKLAMLREAMGAAKRTEDSRSVIGSMGKINTAESLMAIASYLTEPALTERAGKAALSVVRKLKGRPADKIRQALRQVLEHTKAEDTRKAATELLEGL
ncbi:MAG: HEAT repeat domain-containing protein [Armatimonadota bacterium]|jgi:HEAT repeat protein